MNRTDTHDVVRAIDVKQLRPLLCRGVLTHRGGDRAIGSIRGDLVAMRVVAIDDLTDHHRAVGHAVHRHFVLEALDALGARHRLQRSLEHLARRQRRRRAETRQQAVDDQRDHSGRCQRRHQAEASPDRWRARAQHRRTANPTALGDRVAEASLQC